MVSGALDVNFNTTAGSGPNSTVTSLLVTAAGLYLGGNFTSYRGDAKGYRLAKVDLNNGSLDTTFNTTSGSGPNGAVYSITPSVNGSTLHLGGAFDTYRGKSGGMISVSPSTGEPIW